MTAAKQQGDYSSCDFWFCGIKLAFCDIQARAFAHSFRHGIVKLQAVSARVNLRRVNGIGCEVSEGQIEALTICRHIIDELLKLEE